MSDIEILALIDVDKCRAELKRLTEEKDGLKDAYWSANERAESAETKLFLEVQKNKQLEEQIDRIKRAIRKVVKE